MYMTFNTWATTSEKTKTIIEENPRHYWKKTSKQKYFKTVDNLMVQSYKQEDQRVFLHSYGTSCSSYCQEFLNRVNCKACGVVWKTITSNLQENTDTLKLSFSLALSIYGRVLVATQHKIFCGWSNTNLENKSRFSINFLLVESSCCICIINRYYDKI